MGSIIVMNNSTAPISVFVSKYSNTGGDDSWIVLAPGQREAWSRTFWELVAFTNAEDRVNRAGVYVPADSVITFHDLQNISVA